MEEGRVGAEGERVTNTATSSLGLKAAHWTHCPVSPLPPSVPSMPPLLPSPLEVTTALFILILVHIVTLERGC